VRKLEARFLLTIYARAELKASEEDRKAVMTTVVGDVATRYFSLLYQASETIPDGFAQKVLVLGFLCATSVSFVSLWCGFTRNSSTTEAQRTQRLHREERDRDFLCKAIPDTERAFEPSRQ